MARRLEEVTRGDIDAIRYDDLSFDGSHGHVGVTLFMPSIRQLGIKGEPEIISPYSAGWGEGLGAARASCEGLVRSANVMAATIEYPRKRVAVHEILQFRTEVFGEVIRHIRERTMYDWATLVVAGYSRGTAPARMATVEHERRVAARCGERHEVLSGTAGQLQAETLPVGLELQRGRGLRIGAGLVDESARDERADHAVNIDAADRRNARPAHWLPIADDGQRLQGCAGQLRTRAIE